MVGYAAFLVHWRLDPRCLGTCQKIVNCAGLSLTANPLRAPEFVVFFTRATKKKSEVRVTKPYP
jgi:hypothetical protein